MTTGNKIHQTINYNQFRPLPGNRPVEPKRVLKLIKSIESIGQLVPIIVNERNEIVDGQARLAALQALHQPVVYIMMPGYGHKECVEMNSSQTGWGAAAYIKSFADLGNTAYIYLQSLTREFKLPMNVILSAASSNVNSHIGALGIKDGTFQMSAADYESARETLDYVNQFVPDISKLKGRLEYYYMALIVCYRSISGVNKKKLLEKVRAYGHKLCAVESIDTAMGQLEQVYNYKNQNKIYLQGEYRKYCDQNRAKKGGK